MRVPEDSNQAERKCLAVTVFLWTNERNEKHKGQKKAKAAYLCCALGLLLYPTKVKAAA